jgi:hypothetical protein
LTKHVVWVLSDFKGHIIGLANIYALNNVSKRATLWDSLAKELSKARWLFHDDFNNVEAQERRPFACSDALERTNGLE